MAATFKALLIQLTTLLREYATESINWQDRNQQISLGSRESYEKLHSEIDLFGKPRPESIEKGQIWMTHPLDLDNNSNTSAGIPILFVILEKTTLNGHEMLRGLAAIPAGKFANLSRLVDEEKKEPIFLLDPDSPVGPLLIFTFLPRLFHAEHLVTYFGKVSEAIKPTPRWPSKKRELGDDLSFAFMKLSEVFLDLTDVYFREAEKIQSPISTA